MNRYWKLLHYELYRIRKLYLAMFVLTLLMQVTGLIIYAHSFMADVHRSLLTGSPQAADVNAPMRRIDFASFTNNLWFIAPIMICASLLLLYVFLIWYRDWLGKNVFIYRLFMIPTSRMSVYGAKLVAIVLMVLGLVAFELLLLPAENSLFNLMVPADYRVSLPIPELVASHSLLKILAPASWIDFLLFYALGVAGVIIVFTAILIERSYRIKGAIGGFVYGALSLGIMLTPLYVMNLGFPYYFYPVEEVGVEVTVGILLVAGSLRFSAFLIKKKVSV